MNVKQRAKPPPSPLLWLHAVVAANEALPTTTAGMKWIAVLSHCSTWFDKNHLLGHSWRNSEDLVLWMTEYSGRRDCGGSEAVVASRFVGSRNDTVFLAAAGKNRIATETTLPSNPINRRMEIWSCFTFSLFVDRASPIPSTTMRRHKTVHLIVCFLFSPTEHLSLCSAKSIYDYTYLFECDFLLRLIHLILWLPFPVLQSANGWIVVGLWKKALSDKSSYIESKWGWMVLVVVVLLRQVIIVMYYTRSIIDQWWFKHVHFYTLLSPLSPSIVNWICTLCRQSIVLLLCSLSTYNTFILDEEYITRR